MLIWFPFVEKKLPFFCLISKLIVKAIVKKIVDKIGYNIYAESFFNIKISIPTIRIL